MLYLQVRQHQLIPAFALTDYKVQGQTLRQFIINVCRRHRMPWMTLASFYVLVSRVREMAGLRVLHHDQAGLNAVSELLPDPYLHAWVNGFDEEGNWKDELAAAALKAVRAIQGPAKKAAAAAKKKRRKVTWGRPGGGPRGGPGGVPGGQKSASQPRKGQRRAAGSPTKAAGSSKAARKRAPKDAP